MKRCWLLLIPGALSIAGCFASMPRHHCERIRNAKWVDEEPEIDVEKTCRQKGGKWTIEHQYKSAAD